MRASIEISFLAQLHCYKLGLFLLSSMPSSVSPPSPAVDSGALRSSITAVVGPLARTHEPESQEIILKNPPKGYL